MEPETRARVMSDVAALAGVSHQTVSRVINGHPNVAPHTRERVERAIAELGYRPNIAARALVTGSTRTIGLVTVKINQYGPAQTMVGLEKAARAAGYSLSVSILDDASAGAMRDAVDTFVAQRVDGIVALSTYDDAAEALRTLDPPVPLVTVQAGGAEDRPSVGVDQAAGARLATRTRRRPAAASTGGARNCSRPAPRCPSACSATGSPRPDTPPDACLRPGSAAART